MWNLAGVLEWIVDEYLSTSLNMQGLTHPSSGRQFIWLEQFSILFTEKNLGGGEKMLSKIS